MTPGPPDPLDLELLYRALSPLVEEALRLGFRYRTREGRLAVLPKLSPPEVDDLCQESFRCLFEQIERRNFDARRPVRPYLLRITRNLAIGWIHRRSLERARAGVSALEPAPSPEQMVLEKERRAQAKALLEGLSERERLIVQRCMIGPRTQAEIGAELGLSRDQVARIIAKIRAKARRAQARARSARE